MAELPEKNNTAADFDEDDIIALSDDELDSILGSAEITDAPIADIEIDILGGDAGSSADAVALATPHAPVDSDVPAGNGFFSDAGDDETISLPDEDLEAILDSSGTVDDEQSIPEQPEPDLVSLDDGRDGEFGAGPSIGSDETVVADFGIDDEPTALADDDFVILDDEPLFSTTELAPAFDFDKDDAMIIEEEIPPELPATVDTAEPVGETVPAATSVPEAAEENFAGDDAGPVVEISGASLDDLFATDGSLDEFSIEEPAIVAGRSDPDAVPSFDDLPVIDETAVPPPGEPVFALEQGAAPDEGDAVADLLIDEEPYTVDVGPDAEIGSGRDVLDDVEEELIELEPVPAGDGFGDTARNEILIDDEPSAWDSGSAASAETVPAEKATASAGVVPIVDSVDLANEPVEIMEEEIVFERARTMPAEEEPVAGSPDGIPVAAGVQDDGQPSESLDALLEEMETVEADLLDIDTISEMRDEVLDEPEEIALVDAAGKVPGKDLEEVVEGMPERMRDDMRKVLGYLDNLFDELPDEKVKEFASSEYYDIYSRLFKELGI